jgi:hypothetical protein
VSTAEVDVATEPHATRIVVWDVPSSVVAGETFRLKVGLKCSRACQLGGTQFAICDAEGAQVASGTVGSDPWPGSTALHFAEVEVSAPGVEGLHLWEIRVPASKVEIPHEEQRSDTFGVRSVPAPELLVRVEVIDRDAQASLNGASVVMYPYRAVTDERGVAEIRAARGRYRLQVSRAKYLPGSHSIDVTGDVTTTVALDPEPLTNPDDRYVF